MAKFYLNEFRSKTPAAAGSPQGAEVPVGPYKRSGEPVKVTPAKYFGVDARVQNIDIQKNIPSLMQGKLPDKLSNALVGGQLERGQAWAGAAESLGNLASTIGNIAGKLQYSKDLADKSRYKNLISLSEAAFNEEVAEKNLNAMQQLELAKSYHDTLDADIGSLGLSRDNIDQAGVEVQLFKAKHRTELTHKMREEQMKSDAAAIDTRMTQAVNAGDPEGAMDALEDALQAQLINKGQYDKKKQELYIAFDERNAQQDIGSNPRAALEILENDVRTGKSDAYPNLNPGQRKELRDQAKSEVTRREMETKETILNGIADGTLKTPENIDDAAGGNLGANDVAALKARQAEPGPEYSPESYSKIELAIDNYVKEDLTTGAPEYHRILDMIAEGAPKKEQTDLIDRLQKKRDKQKDNLPGKDWFPELLNEFTNMTEDGRFIPKVKSGWSGSEPALNVETLRKNDAVGMQYRLEHKAEIDAMWDRSRSMQILMRKWRQEHPGDDEQTIKDARKYQNELLNLDSSQSGQEAIRKQLQIQLPSTGVMGTKPTSMLGPVIPNPDIAAERKQAVAQLKEPGMRQLVAAVLQHEHGDPEGNADVLESLVNRAVATGRHPRDLIRSGFYGPVNRGEVDRMLRNGVPESVLNVYDSALAAVAAGRNRILGRTDQGMPNEVRPRGRIMVFGEAYGWHRGTPEERRTAAARAAG